MPANTQRGRTQRTATRGRSAPTRKTQKSNGSGARSSQAKASKSSSRARSSANASRARSNNRSQSGSNGSRASSNGNAAQSGHSALTDIGISALSATIGVAGGVLLGRTALQRNRKVLGVSVPSKVDFGDIGQQIGEAGRQFGKLASEVNAVRRKAEKIGRVLT
jgi:hypothetical protein